MPPLLPHFLAYCGGILAAHPAARHFLAPYFPPLLLGAAACALAWQWRNHRAAGYLLLALCFCAGWQGPSWRLHLRPESHILLHVRDGEPAKAAGWVANAPQADPARTRYVIALTSIQYGDDPPVTVSGKARITIHSPGAEWRQGDALAIEKIRLKRPRNFKNPGRFDYRSWLEDQGISVIGSLARPELAIKTGEHPLSFWETFRRDARQNIAALMAAHLSAEEKALLEGMLLGEQQNLPEDIKENYRITGLSHLLAVSGMNFNFVASTVYFLAYPAAFAIFLRFSPQMARAGLARQTAALCALAAIVFYGVLVGAQTSAWRAEIMSGIFLAAVLLDRASRTWNNLLIAACVILLWTPNALFDIGFQLSFLAVCAILFALRFSPFPDDATEPGTSADWWRRHFLTGTLLVSFAANLGVLPLLAWYFNRVSLIGFALNLLIVPVSGALITLALLVFSAGLAWPGLATPFMPLISWLAKLLIIVPEMSAAVPAAAVATVAPSPAWFLLYYFLLFGGLFALRRHRQQARAPTGYPAWLKQFQRGLSLAGFWLILWTLWPDFPRFAADKLSVTVIDVGEGDAALIRFPNGQNLLIDGGGFPGNAMNAGRMILAPLLWKSQIRSLTYIAATHADNDHISGLESLLEFFPVRHFLWHDAPVKDARLLAFRGKALRHGAEPVTLHAGEPWRVGEATLTLLHPGAAFTALAETQRVRRNGNNFSLVFKLEYRDFTMLFTGDIEARAEEYLLAQGESLRADFLKAPHHGGKNSSTFRFLETVRPRTVIVSAGHLNAYHHPHPLALERYRQIGADVRRTDLHGAITIVTDGYRHEITTHEDL